MHLPAPDPLQTLRDLLASLTVTVLCHPDDLEAVQAAAESIDHSQPLRVLPSPAVLPGHLISLQGRDLPLTPGPRRRSDD
jgi:hypothetical protein